MIEDLELVYWVQIGMNQQPTCRAVGLYYYSFGTCYEIELVVK